MDPEDRIEHYAYLAADVCKAAALAALPVAVTTRSDERFSGIASCRLSDPGELLRVGDRPVHRDEVVSITIDAPVERP